ncbi:hypothetical protein K8U54_19180 [Pseudomonas fulva]|uniref:hypothetical protein n=1 Tax=Pseudomonas fulva TaxID=47880 RepID=UPI00201DE0E7|nr:hypothetical protein [Pseudomonas fulva]UQY33814.1 hypothetical protein K8U54_19180 [Pseudomonas fulva]
MAKLYIVKTTVHAIPKKGGKKVIIKSSKDPQPVPGEFVKELLASNAIEEAGSDNTATADTTAAPAGGAAGGGAGAGGSGDDATGD